MIFSDEQKARYYDELKQASLHLGLELDAEKLQQLIDYLQLLAKWNKAYNLTAVRSPDDMLYRHLVDSLSVVPYITEERIIDVGTGPGLPGIPLAIVFPEKHFHLLDSNIKKTRFLTQCQIELKLPNIEVVHGRVESFRDRAGFKQVVSRAFTSISNMVDICKHLLAENGQFLAMKGLEPADEIAKIDAMFRVSDTIKLDVPACEAERHLIIISRA